MLRVDNLSVAFSDTTVLKSLSFTLGIGESLGIVGESGSGKSISALSLLGLLPSGAKIISGSAQMEVSGKVIDLVPGISQTFSNVRGNLIAMVFQEPMTSLNPSMRCGKQVLEAIELHQNLAYKEGKKRCIELFQEMQLPDPDKVYRSYPFQLSGGQKQRVMIAMALAGNPKLLIADEPTTALDVTVQKEILSLLKEVKKKRGMGLIFISHDLGVISEITQKLLVLKDGVMVENGTTHSLLSKPKHPYTQGLVACRPPLSSRPNRLVTIQDYINNSSKADYPNITENEWNALNSTIFSKKPILEVEGLTVLYITSRNLLGKPTKTFCAVNNLTFNLFPGETLGLVGESGSGKTTLGRAILGLTEISGGRIVYQGVNTSNMSKDQRKSFRREVQLVFQDPFASLNPRHTIGEALMEPIKYHGLMFEKKNIQRKVLDLLDMVSLPSDSFYRYPHEFSGGQRQRIAIARALALNPKVIVCDEMVSALDVSIQAQILNLLNQLKAELGLTYIFISHDLSVVKYMSNRIMVMQQGSMEEFGLSDHVYSNPQSNYTRKLIDSIPGRVS